MNGEVVGIHSSIGPMVTHNFHVPISSFDEGWDRLVKGEVWGGRYDDDDDEDRALLGVRGRTVDGKCVISQVFPGMPGDKAGLKEGDVITSVDNRDISTFDQLSTIVSNKKPGDKLRLGVERGGEALRVTAELTGAD
jgi:serine protease Do